MRIPDQSAPINLYKNFTLPKGPCEGEDYEGSADLVSLVFRNIDGPAFCARAAPVFGIRGYGFRAC